MVEMNEFKYATRSQKVTFLLKISCVFTQISTNHGCPNHPTGLDLMEHTSMAAALFEISDRTYATQDENEDVHLRRVMSLDSISAKTY